ncbi:MAG TPA: HEAT repeat domain-containing protein [Pyrinomonadaceae bacterium]|jgi:HEAT repeat protein
MGSLTPSDNSIGVFTTDASLVIQIWDAALVRLTGIPADAARGKPLAELLPHLEEGRLLGRFRRVLDEGTVEVLAPAFHHYLIPCPPSAPSKHFDRMQQRVTIAPLREDGRTVGALVTVEDVTARIERERGLSEQLAGGDGGARLDAARAFAEDESLEPARPLLAALGDEDWRVRRAAVEGLSRRAAPDAIAALLTSVRENHKNLGLLNSALQVLAMSDVDTLSQLVEFLNGEDADLRMQAALALGEQRDERAVPALLRALEDADTNVRYHAIEALGKLRAAEAADALAGVAETRDFFLAFPALDALTRVGDARVAPRVAPLLEDELLREAAADALGRLGDEETVAPLAALLNTPHAPAPTVARALAALHDRYERLYGEGAHVADLTRAAINPTGARNLLDALNESSAGELRPLALVVGWLEGAAVERALTRLLGRPDARGEVVEALVRHGPRVTDLLIEQLESEDLEIRKSAVVALGRIGDARATPALVEVLGEDPELVIQAADALAKVGDPRAFDALLALVGDPAAAVRQAAVGALNSLGSPEMPGRVLPLLEDADPNVRESAVKIAGYFGYAECADLLLERCRDEDERVRRAAVEHLPFLEDERATPALARALRHETPKVRAAAAGAMALAEGPEVSARLMEALADEDAWVRHFAARSLGRRKAVESADALAVLARDDKSNHVRIAAVEALGHVGGEGAARVVAPLVKSGEPDLVRAAVAALGRIRRPDAQPPLFEALHSPDAEVRAEAAGALGARGDAEAAGRLLRVAAADGESLVVEAATEALRRLATPEAIAGLVALTADPARREGAVAALARTGEALLEEVARGLSPRQAAGVRRAVVEALGRMKSQRASELLRLAYEDADASVRAAAMSYGRSAFGGRPEDLG